MRRHGFFRASLAVAAGLASLSLALWVYPQVTRPLAVKRDMMLRAVDVNKGQFEATTSKSGTGACDFDLLSKRVWMAALLVPGKTNNAAVTFALPAFGVEGLSVPGAKVTATFMVGEIMGNAVASLVVINETTHTETAGKTYNLNQPGPFTLTTDPFTLQPGNKYKARATLMVDGYFNQGIPNHQFIGCAGAIQKIEWSF
jgi:hypothetical protein